MPSTRARTSTDRYACTLPTYSRMTGTVATRTGMTITSGAGAAAFATSFFSPQPASASTSARAAPRARRDDAAGGKAANRRITETSRTVSESVPAGRRDDGEDGPGCPGVRPARLRSGGPRG